MKLSVCIDAVMNKMPAPQAIEQLHNLGCEAFEFWCWWDRNIDEIYEAIQKTKLIPVTMCTKFVSLVDPSLCNKYIDGLCESIEVAKKLGVHTLISQVGNDTGASRVCQHESIVQGLRECVPFLEKEGITLVVEPLNTYIDHKGYYLSSSAEGFQIIDEVSSDNVKLLFDIYHQQIMEGNLINNITANIDKIGHMHAAGLPGRHELNYGEINYKSIFRAIDGTDYNGYIGLEYFPIDEPEKGILEYIR